MMKSGAALGYSLTGSFTSAIPPATTISKDRTAAKIGRVMKNCASFIIISLVFSVLSVFSVVKSLSPQRSQRECLHRHLHRIDMRSRPNALKPIHHNDVGRLEPTAHDAKSIDHRPELHGAVFDGAVS